MNDQPGWYAVKAVYRLDVLSGPEGAARYSAFEERIVLLQASSADAALEIGEREAIRYAADGTWPNAEGDEVRTRYLDACDVFTLSDVPGEGAEVFSRLLFIEPATSDSAIVDRMLGSEGELSSPAQQRFEPDLARFAEAKKQEPRGETN